MATVNESGLLLEQMQENGQNVLRRKIFWVNRWQLDPLHPDTTLTGGRNIKGHCRLADHRSVHPTKKTHRSGASSLMKRGQSQLARMAS